MQEKLEKICKDHIKQIVESGADKLFSLNGSRMKPSIEILMIRMREDGSVKIPVGTKRNPVGLLEPQVKFICFYADSGNNFIKDKDKIIEYISNNKDEGDTIKFEMDDEFQYMCATFNIKGDNNGK